MKPVLYGVVIFGCVCVAISPHETHADDSNAVSLFDRNSLTGWTYGSEPPNGWRMENGLLRGEPAATPLLSGWSWGDVELTLRWRVKDNAQWRLTLRKVPDGARIVDVILGEVTPISPGIVTQANDSVKMVLSPSSDGWHTAKLTSRGGLLNVKAESGPQKDNAAFSEGGSVTEIAKGDSRFTVELALINGSGAMRDFKVLEPAGKPLYNGQDLSGWWTPGNRDSWKPEGESIVCVNKNGNYLRTEHEYANFTLALDYKMAKGGNSGIGIRTTRNGWPSGDGMELQMLDERPGTPITRHST
ncbi:MAG: family 16 glycoside hydrolase, partial [Pirellulales bacterium]